MDPTTIIPTLLDLSLRLFDSVQQQRGRRQQTQAEQLSQASELFGKIANTISDSAQCLRRGEYPAGHCGEMAEYARVLPTLLTGIVPAEQVDRYVAALMEAHQVEQLCAYLNHTDDYTRKHQLDQMHLAAGTFRAAAAVVKIQ
jgi:hypothetical protein